MYQKDQILATDVGYRQLKFVSRKKEGVFKAVIAPETSAADKDTYNVLSKASPLVVDGQAYWTGEDAMYQPSAITSAQNQRMTTELAKILVAAAVWESELEGEVTLSTGLPLDLYAKERALTESTWLNRKMVIEKDGIRREIIFNRVELLPQGIAALLYALSLKKIADLWPTSGLVTLTDIGERTTDIATVRADTLEPIRGLCFSIETGIRDLKQQIIRIAKQQIPLLPDFLADDILKTGKVSYRRQQFDFTSDLKECINQFAIQLVGEIQTRFSSSDALVAMALQAGGGAELLGEEIGKIYMSDVIEEPTMANVLGYFQQANGR